MSEEGQSPKTKENEVVAPHPILAKIKPKLEYSKRRCPFCWHNKAYRKYDIQCVDDAHWYCENCNKRIG